MLKYNNQNIKSNKPKEGIVSIESLYYNNDEFLRKPLNEVSTEIQRRKNSDESPVSRYRQ